MSGLQQHAVSELETSMGIKVENPLETYCSACTINWKIIMFFVNGTSCSRLHLWFYSGNCSDSGEITGCKMRVKYICKCYSVLEASLVLGEAVLEFVLPFIIVCCRILSGSLRLVRAPKTWSC